MVMPLHKRTQEVLHFAGEEALRLNHVTLAGGHVLLGILIRGTGVAAQMLFDAMTLDRLRLAVAVDSPRGFGTRLLNVEALMKSPKLQEAISCAEEWAHALGDEEICPVHLLIAMMAVKDPGVEWILKHFKFTNFSEFSDKLVAVYQEKKNTKKTIADLCARVAHLEAFLKARNMTA